MRRLQRLPTLSHTTCIRGTCPRIYESTPATWSSTRSFSVGSRQLAEDNDNVPRHRQSRNQRLRRQNDVLQSELQQQEAPKSDVSPDSSSSPSSLFRYSTPQSRQQLGSRASPRDSKKETGSPPARQASRQIIPTNDEDLAVDNAERPTRVGRNVRGGGVVVVRASNSGARGGRGERVVRGRGSGARGGRGGRGGVRAHRVGGRRDMEGEGSEGDSDEAHPEFGNVDPEDKDGYMFLDDHYSEQFVNEWDTRGYGETMDMTSNLLERIANIETVQKEQKTAENPRSEIAQRCEEELRDVDEGIKSAFLRLERTRDEALVPHKPDSIDLDGFYKKNIGAVTVGSGGSGNVMEDALRHLGAREGHTFQYPKELARRLIAGEFVKFKSHTERKEVVEAIQQVANEKNAPPEWKKVKFMPLDPSARKDVAQRVVQGQSMGDRARQGELIEAGKMKGPQDVLDVASRLAGGHYPGAKMQTVLQTIREMLPSDRPRQGQQQASK